MARPNGNRFSVYTCEEKTVLGVINELAQENIQVTKEIEVINKVLEEKTNLYGDHKGSWQGLNRPTMSEEGIRATVEDIIDNKIPSIQTSLDHIVHKLEGDKSYNIIDFGAIGDGVTDNTLAFIKAFNEIPNNSTLIIPNG